MLSASQWTSSNLPNACAGRGGAVGKTGPLGFEGQRGQNGSDGQPGRRGPRGPRGPSGVTGPAGPTGFNASESYIRETFRSMGVPNAIYNVALEFDSPGSLFTFEIGTSNKFRITAPSYLESGYWFITKYYHSDPITLYLDTVDTSDGYAATARTYVISRGLLGNTSTWYVYYYKDRVTNTNNFYLY